MIEISSKPPSSTPSSRLKESRSRPESFLGTLPVNVQRLNRFAQHCVQFSSVILAKILNIFKWFSLYVPHQAQTFCSKNDWRKPDADHSPCLKSQELMSRILCATSRNWAIEQEDWKIYKTYLYFKKIYPKMNYTRSRSARTQKKLNY